MKTLVLAVSVLTLSTPAFASHFERCEFETVVENVTTKVPYLNQQAFQDNTQNTFSGLLEVKIINAKGLEGSYIDCSGYVGQSKVILLSDKDIKNYKPGDSVKFHFSLGNNRTPNGVRYNVHWTQIN